MNKRALAVSGLALALAVAGPLAAAEPSALVAIGKEMTDKSGMLQLPVRLVAGAAKGVKVGADGRVRGMVTVVANGAATAAGNRSVYLTDAGMVVGSATTDAKGAFEIAAKPGAFTFMAGKFENAGVARKLTRTDADAIQTVALEADAPKSPAPLPTAAASNDPFAGRKILVANDVVEVEAGKFSGIVTKIDQGKRVAIGETGLYLVRNGAIIGKATSAADGAFSFADVTEGPVMLISSTQPLTAETASTNVPGAMSQKLVISKAAGLASATPAEFKVDGEDVLVRVQFSDCPGCGGSVVDMAPISGDMGTAIAGTTVGAPCDACGTGVASYGGGGGGGFGGGGCVSGCGGGGGGGIGGGRGGLGLLGIAGLVAGIVALSSNHNNGTGGTSAATSSKP